MADALATQKADTLPPEGTPHPLYPKVMNVGLPSPPPDASSASETILAQALAFCAQKMGFDDLEATAEHLRQGNRTACGYCFYSIAKQVAEAIGSLDENVRTVYTLDYDATPEDLCFAQDPPARNGVAWGASLIHLIVWTRRKTAALTSLAAALDRTLAQAYSELLGAHKATNGHALRGPRLPSSLLDVQVIDDSDVEADIGYAALLGSIHHRPIQIWERQSSR